MLKGMFCMILVLRVWGRNLSEVLFSGGIFPFPCRWVVTSSYSELCPLVNTKCNV